MIINANITPDNVRSWPMHSHGYVEVMYYLEGEGFLRTDGGRVAFRPNMAIVVPKGRMHGSVSKDGFKNISIGLDLPEADIFDDVTVLCDNERGEILSLAKMIFARKDEDSRYSDLLISAFIELLMRSGNERYSALDVALDRIYVCLSTRFYDSQLSCSELLKNSGFAEDYIRERFRERFGTAPTEFLRLQRLKYALRVCDIYNGNISVERLAEMCGFMDSAYFSCCFKRAIGISPKKYMMNLTKKPQSSGK